MSSVEAAIIDEEATKSQDALQTSMHDVRSTRIPWASLVDLWVMFLICILKHLNIAL